MGGGVRGGGQGGGGAPAPPVRVGELLCTVAAADAAAFFGACPPDVGWAQAPAWAGVPERQSLRLPSGVLSVRRV